MASAVTGRIAALSAIAALAIAAPAARAGDTGGSAPARTLAVSGEAEVKAVPDQARLSAGVVSQAATAEDALAANSRAMNEVFAELKRQGIPDRAIQTSEFQVSPQYDTGKDGNSPPKIVGYQVSNTVTVVVDDLAKVGPAIDALVASGANSMGGISFSVRDPKPLLAEARAGAVKDALARAETYAKAAGVTLGRIVSISEGGSFAPPRMMMAAAPMMARATPIAAGEESVSASVSMTFEIK